MANRSALVVATGTYQDPELRQLRAPAQDAAALAAVLGDQAIGDFEVQQVIDRQSHAIALALETFFADRGLDDLLLAHISCHGLKDDEGRLFFAGTDTQRRWLLSTAVAAQLLYSLMEGCRARSIVLLLDCCYSGAFMPGSRGDPGIQLQERLQGRGRAILTASNALEYSWEGEQLTARPQPSVFTGAIVDGLRTGAADRDQDGVISVTDLYDHVYDRVRASQRGQTPKLWALDFEQNVYIARNPAPIKVQPTALPPEFQASIDSPLSGARAGVITDLERLLRSSNRGLALAAREALEQLRDDDSRTVGAAAADVLVRHPFEAVADLAVSHSHERPGPGKRPQTTEPNIRSARVKSMPTLSAEAPETILIPRGRFWAGLTHEQIRVVDTYHRSNQLPHRLVELPAFTITKFPVTNDEFARFIAASGRPAPKHWNGPTPPQPLRDHPVVWVTWAMATAYCSWLSDVIGKPYRLPTEEEWEKAARGTDDRIYPWGNEPDALPYKRSHGTTPVTAHSPAGDSQYGVADMVLNVREWTSTLKRDGAHEYVTVRGAGFRMEKGYELWCGYRAVLVKGAKASIGFRVAASLGSVD